MKFLPAYLRYGHFKTVDSGINLIELVASTFILGNLSLVLKRYNRGKWNSHEWHMKSFARHSDYCFLTDVGCQYNPNIIEKFLGFIEDNPGCVGVTGRRVAQTYHQQADPSSVNQEDNFSQGMLRALQSHLFEAENNTR